MEKLIDAPLANLFFNPLPRILIGLGVFLSVLSLAGIFQSKAENFMNDQSLQSLQYGFSSLSLSIGVAVIIGSLHKLMTDYLKHRGQELVQMIENLFHNQTNSESRTFEVEALNTALSNSTAAIKDAVKVLGEKQEDVVKRLITQTIDSYTASVGKSTEQQFKNLQEIMDDTVAQSKQASERLATRFDVCASKISEIHDHLNEAEKEARINIVDDVKKLISTLTKEVEGYYSAYELSIKDGFEALDKQAKAKATISSDSEKLLLELNKTTSDLKEISKASDTMKAQFDNVAKGLNDLLKQIEIMGPMTAAKKEKLAEDLKKLRGKATTKTPPKKPVKKRTPKK